MKEPNVMKRLAHLHIVRYYGYEVVKGEYGPGLSIARPGLSIAR